MPAYAVVYRESRDRKRRQAEALDMSNDRMTACSVTRGAGDQELLTVREVEINAPTPYTACCEVLDD